MEIRLLCDHREILVGERTRLINRLRELRDLIRVHRPELLAETGCGPVTAAILIGQTAGAERFASDAQFARMAGVAPIPASSGRRDQHRLHRGGNRQLNRALHIITITRGRIDPTTTRAYLARKETEEQEPHRGDALPQAPPRTPLSPAAPAASSTWHAASGTWHRASAADVLRYTPDIMRGLEADSRGRLQCLMRRRKAHLRRLMSAAALSGTA